MKNFFGRPAVLWMATLWLVTLGTTAVAQSENAGPNGRFEVTVTNVSSSVYDMSDFPGLLSLNYEIRDRNTNMLARAYYDVSFAQDGAGKVTGAGTNQVQFGFRSAGGGWASLGPYNARYQVKGAISSTATKTRFSFSASSSGATPLSETLKMRVNLKYQDQVVIDRIEKVLNGKTLTQASANSETISQRRPWGPVPLTTTYFGDGSWKAALNLATTANRITGEATVTVAQTERVFPFSVRGVYRPATQQSRLVLTGKDLGKGSSLQVVLTGTNITAIKGKLTGQVVKENF
jgi:hypothetical protein